MEPLISTRPGSEGVSLVLPTAEVWIVDAKSSSLHPASSGFAHRDSYSFRPPPRRPLPSSSPPILSQFLVTWAQICCSVKEPSPES